MLSVGFTYDDVTMADTVAIEAGLGKLIDTVVADVGELDVLVDVIASVVIEDGPGELIGAVSAAVGTLDVVVDVAAAKDELNDIIADVVITVGGPVDIDIVGVPSPSAPYSCCRPRKYSR